MLIPALSGLWRISRPESVTADLNFLMIAAGSSVTYTVPAGVPPVVDIFFSGVCRSMIRAPTSRIDALGHDERLAEARVEALGHVARELHVLPLVVPDWHLIGVVEQDVGDHQDRVVEDPRGDELLLRGLVLELRHARELAVAGDAVQQPLQLGVLDHVALAEEDAALRIQTCRHPARPAGHSTSLRSLAGS